MENKMIISKEAHEKLEKAQFNALMASADAMICLNHIHNQITVERKIIYGDETYEEQDLSKAILHKENLERVYVKIDQAHDLIAKAFTILDEIYSQEHQAYMDYYYPAVTENETEEEDLFIKEEVK